MLFPNVNALILAFAFLFSFMKNEIVIGNIGNTQGVNNGSQTGNKDKMKTIKDFSFSAVFPNLFSFTITGVSLDLRVILFYRSGVYISHKSESKIGFTGTHIPRPYRPAHQCCPDNKAFAGVYLYFLMENSFLFKILGVYFKNIIVFLIGFDISVTLQQAHSSCRG
jgi:hypothetical protein